MAEKKTSLVDPMIKELLGYDAAQFRQIVLLPQGEFRKILTASSDERSPILKRLFDVSLYESFVQKIRNQASTMHRAIKDERLRKNTMLEGITEGELKEDIKSREKTIAELEDNLKDLVIQESAHQKALTAGETLIEKFTSLADAKVDEEKFKLEAGTIKIDEARLVNGRSALSVLPTEKLKDNALQELSEASKQLTEANSTFDNALKNHEEAKTNLQQATGQQSEYDAATEKVQELNRWQTILDKVVVLQAPVNESKLALKIVLALEQEAKDVVVVELASVKETQRHAKSSFTKMEIKSRQAAEGFDRSLKISKLSVDSYKAAKTDVARLEEIEEAIQSHKIKVASNKDRTLRLMGEIGGQESPNLAFLQSTAKRCGDKLDVDQADKTRLATELEQKRKIFASVIELSGKLLELEKKFAPLGEISNLVSGENDLKVRLPDFAIAAMFDEILEATNLRLGPMTNQRYRLHRPAETTGGRKKRGLEISVFDAYTEKSRSTSSLSGGEGFQASLALALGLSDVVQQNSGGIKLDTIFIDEGFGTLDQETLDTALDTLCSLTGEMRVVGLISHTEQVKNLITEGFDIEMTPSGSHIYARKNTIL